jgi:hypothetical protein
VAGLKSLTADRVLEALSDRVAPVLFPPKRKVGRGNGSHPRDFLDRYELTGHHGSTSVKK